MICILVATCNYVGLEQEIQNDENLLILNFELILILNQFNFGRKVFEPPNVNKTFLFNLLLSFLKEIMMMEDIISGQNNLRNALTSCDDPLKAIEAFQVKFSKVL